MIYVVLLPEYNLSLDNNIEFIFSIQFIKYNGYDKFKDTIISLYNIDGVVMNTNFKMHAELIVTIRESDIARVATYFTNKLKSKPINSFNYMNSYSNKNSLCMYSVYFKCNILSIFSGDLKSLKKEVNYNYLKIFRIVNKLKIEFKKDYSLQCKQYKKIEIDVAVNIIESDNSQAEGELFTIYNDCFVSKDMPRVVSIK
jgi:hypothetical protein